MYSCGTAYLLWLGCGLGLCGLHRFYAGKPLSGLLWLFTGGLCGVGQLFDLLFIPGMVARANRLCGWGGNRNTNVITIVNGRGRKRSRRKISRN